MRTLSLRLPAMVFGLTFFALCGVAVAPLPASASMVTMDYAGTNIYDSTGSGLSPVPAGNWMTATFTDINATTVQLTINTSGFANGVYLGTKGLYFNFNDPNTTANGVSFTYLSSSSSANAVAATSVSKSNVANTLAAGTGSGYYNFELKWGSTTSTELSWVETVVYDLTATTGINASDFNHTSTGGTIGQLYSAAYLQQTSGDAYTYTNTPVLGGSPTPIPGTLLLFAPGLVGLAAFRKRFMV